MASWPAQWSAGIFLTIGRLTRYCHFTPDAFSLWTSRRRSLFLSGFFVRVWDQDQRPCRPHQLGRFRAGRSSWGWLTFHAARHLGQILRVPPFFQESLKRHATYLFAQLKSQLDTGNKYLPAILSFLRLWTDHSIRILWGHWDSVWGIWQPARIF